MGGKSGTRRGASRSGGGGGGDAPSPAEAAIGASAQADVFGPSNATVEHEPEGLARAREDARVEAIFGRRLSDQELASLVGAPADSRVGVRALPSRERELKINISGAGLSATRTVIGSPSGSIKIHNDYFSLRDTGTGLGTEVFGRQVEQATKLGVDKIETLAARSASFNGYYTWARLGYSAKIPKTVQARLPENLKGAKDINTLMRTSEGRDFWRQHGVTTNMTFNLKPGSPSHRFHTEYLRERGLLK